MTKNTGKTAAKAAAAPKTEAVAKTEETGAQTNAAQETTEQQQPPAGEQPSSEQVDTTAADAGQADNAGDDAQGSNQDSEQSLFFQFGADAIENGDAAQALLELGFPLKVEITNEMPRRVTFPELKGLLLAHVAGLPELKTKPAVFANADQLHRFVTDVHALCVFNGFTKGVTVTAAV